MPNFLPLLRVFLPSALAAALAGCATGQPPAAAACADSGEAIACTRQGAVRGVVANGTVAFHNMPYAAPPVGALRWQPPMPAGAWQGVRDGSRFGPMCPQLAGGAVVGDEDCLTLNVWRPRQAGSAPLPVMVFLTGGGNHAFSGQGSSGFGGVPYNGHQLASEGVVYVSFNNRLGALGFLAHPALSAEGPDRVSGNYANMDQIAMLRWIRANIAAFGGDPRRVMLFGTSAGGASICALMAAPAARGLFHAVSMQSSVPTGCELQTLAEAESGTGARVAQALGCTAPATAACLRSQSTEAIVRAVPGTFGVLPRIYGPNVDGKLFPEQPLRTIARGAHAHVPVLLGNSTEETMLFVGAVGPVGDEASLDVALGRVFGGAAVPRIRERYPLGGFPSAREMLVKATTDALFTCSNRRLARLLAARQREPVHRYLFSHVMENDPELQGQRAVHTIEHAFLFPWQGSYRPTAADLAVQATMVAHWTHLARTGTVAATAAAWPPALPGDRLLLIGPDRGGWTRADCDFWDAMLLPWPHL